jgi:alpha-amylase/alpha-mannosidase (GH57 family)
MSRRRIRHDGIHRGTITIKIDVALLEWLKQYDNRSETIESAVARLKRTTENEQTTLTTFDPDFAFMPVPVRHAARMKRYVEEYETRGIRPDTSRYLKYELKRWWLAVKDLESGGDLAAVDPEV